MNTFKKISFATIVLGSVATMTAFANIMPAVSALSKEGIKFRYTPNDDIQAGFQTEEGRDNLVFVNGETKREGDYEYREVWSPAYSGGPISSSKLEQLLIDNGQQKFGGWRLSQGDKWIVIYAVRVSATADGTTLRTAMELCAMKADALEKEWTGKDEF